MKSKKVHFIYMNKSGSHLACDPKYGCDSDNDTTDVNHPDLCENCKRTKAYKEAIKKKYKYQNLKKAIENRENIKIIVDENQIDVQKIANSCGILWLDGECLFSTTFNFLFIGSFKNIYAIAHDNDDKINEVSSFREFSLENDCFVDEIKPSREKQISEGWTDEEISKCSFKPHREYGNVQSIFNNIYEELKRAEELHPLFPDDIIHQVAILNEESGESTQAALNSVYDNCDIDEVYKEVIHTAAVVVRMLLNKKEK